ncbi:MAG TPA: 50S ribosomal protein L18 [Candidatus Krumholzibacteria bacterium]|nr:50S ribosomal protein L18 [Candidatus Krumholzibacteria bacterium]
MKKKMHSASEYKRWRRHKRVRNRVIGTPERPRVCVFRSNTHIYAQIIDDTAGRTLVSVSSLKLDAPAAEAAAPATAKPAGKGMKAKDGEAAATAAGRKTTLAREVGRLLAEAAKEKGVSKVAFDRGGYLYHGRVAALAESARKHGLDF